MNKKKSKQKYKRKHSTIYRYKHLIYYCDSSHNQI